MHETRIRVRFSEVDLMGVVYHPNYLSYFEIGRTDLIEKLGFPYSHLEAQQQRLVISEVRVKYHAPARYDQTIIVRTQVTGLSRVRIVFEYEVVSESDERIATGETTLAFVDHSGRPQRMPENLHQVLLDEKRDD